MSLQIDTNKVPSKARVSINALLAPDEEVLCAGQAKADTVATVLAREYWLATGVCFFAILYLATVKGKAAIMELWTSAPLMMLVGTFLVSLMAAYVYCLCAAAMSERTVAYVLTKERLLVVECSGGNLLWSCSLEKIERVREKHVADGTADISFQLSMDEASLLPKNNTRYLPAVVNADELMTAFRGLAKSRLAPKSE